MLLTVSIWANFKPGNNKYAHLIENGTLEKNFSGAFRLEHTPTEGEIYFALGDGSTMVENKNNGQHKNTGWKWNTWNHYILSYNGNVALLYQNGALVDQLSTTLDIREGDGTLGVGRFMAGEFHSRSYVGDADDIRIYNRDLNASEVLQLYNLEKPPANNSPPPTITSQPVADQNATVGSNVTFSVDANGTGLTYQWQKQDANGTWVNIGGATASSYAINSVQAIHAGAYRVAITNADGGTTHSSSSVLNVSGSDPLTQGLVAYYPFNGNANDEAGGDNNGTLVNGPTLSTDRHNHPNSSYSFDGLDDRIDTPQNNFPSGNSGPNHFTLVQDPGTADPNSCRSLGGWKSSSG